MINHDKPPINWCRISSTNSMLFQMGVSLNGGTPKSSILIGFSLINHPFWGSPIFGNTQIYPLRDIYHWTADCYPPPAMPRDRFLHHRKGVGSPSPVPGWEPGTKLEASGEVSYRHLPIPINSACGSWVT